MKLAGSERQRLRAEESRASPKAHASHHLYGLAVARVGVLHERADLPRDVGDARGVGVLRHQGERGEQALMQQRAVLLGYAVEARGGGQRLDELGQRDAVALMGAAPPAGSGRG
jgi:hypothetical protein